MFEILRLVHLGLTAYKHSIGTKKYTLQQNCAIFIANIRYFDPGFDYQKLYKDQEYIGDWLVRDMNKLASIKVTSISSNLGFRYVCRQIFPFAAAQGRLR